MTPPRQKKTAPEETGPPDLAAQEAAALDAELAELSYEQARDELVVVVRRLESGAETLEESLALWERGEALARRCETWLAGAQAKLDARQPATDQDG
ncbi:exodeoxyribonuclease VII small subunit [Kineosporia corallincola]|uniref:exodeoxyribonuclease VII small subunit n=1 Tax=Kineosporia corallincola TaxID=2835133 RepID=UPI0027DF5DCC|nr:exodeoxyribonuclease VII small subunit [Kineosporia corallincola]